MAGIFETRTFLGNIAIPLSPGYGVDPQAFSNRVPGIIIPRDTTAIPSFQTRVYICSPCSPPCNMCEPGVGMHVDYLVHHWGRKGNARTAGVWYKQTPKRRYISVQSGSVSCTMYAECFEPKMELGSVRFSFFHRKVVGFGRLKKKKKKKTETETEHFSVDFSTKIVKWPTFRRVRFACVGIMWHDRGMVSSGLPAVPASAAPHTATRHTVQADIHYYNLQQTIARGAAYSTCCNKNSRIVCGHEDIV